MERAATIGEAREILGKDFVGKEELVLFMRGLGVESDLWDRVSLPSISFSVSDLEDLGGDYLLLYGASSVGNIAFSLRTLRDAFGIDPAVSEPCFYNQDWYLHEPFFDRTLESGWYLLRKSVVAEARGVQPHELLSAGYSFPPAVLCAYAFFAYYFWAKELLWLDDFVWCDDVDHNGDRIYVGRYRDIDQKAKNGFSVHRHLSLRNCYSAIPYSAGKLH